MRLPVIELPPRRAPAPQPLDTGPRSIGAVRMLRISLTDRCNFRCLYCMPTDGVEWLPSGDLLTDREVLDVARAAAGEHDIRRFKLTGGEPTLRPGVVGLVKLLRASGVADDLSMTTNGALLEKLATPLRDAGLDRLTVTRSSPPSRSGPASDSSSIPLVVSDRSSIPSIARSIRTRSTMPCRIVGSPPVSLNRRMPCSLIAARTTSAISSKERIPSFGSQRTPSSGMQ